MGRFKTWLEGMLHVPVVNQTHKYDCGAAALRAVAQYWGVGPDDEGEFIRLCDTSKSLGTDPTDIIKAARKLGLQCHDQKHMTVGTLRKYLDAGRPVICAMQAWGERKDYDELASGHYVVAIGHDDEWVYFEDPSIKGKRARGHLRPHEFSERWADVDRKGRTLYHYGIVLWKDAAPQEQDVVLQSKEIE
jgi:predicted double-glycine peptidase